MFNLYDASGKIIHDGTKEILLFNKVFDDDVSKKAVAAQELLMQDKEDIIDVAMPITIGSELLGGIRVGLTLKSINDDISKMRSSLNAISEKGMRKNLFAMVLITLGFSVFGMILALFIARALSQPIKVLSSLSQRIGRGEYDVDIPVEHSDEIGELASSFNKMTKNLQSSRDEIISAKEYTDNIIRSMINTIVVFTLGGVIKTVNKATYDLLGYQEDELIGRSVNMIFSEKFFESKGLYEVIKKGFVSNVENTYISKDGRKIPVLFSGSIMRDNHGKIQGIVCVAQDISKLKIAEEALRESEERFKSAFEYAAIGMAITALDGTFLRVNNMLCQMVGYTEKELLKKKFKDITHPDNLKENLNLVDQMLEKKTKHFHMEKKYLHKEGHIVWVLVNASVVRNLNEIPLYFVAEIQDITERKQAEIALAQFSKKLVESQEKERKRIASEIHDGLGQNMITIISGIRKCLKSLPNGGKVKDTLSRISLISQQSIDEIREIISNLHPHQLDQLGLKGAIESIINQATQSSEIKFYLDIQDIEDLLPKDVEIHLYRILQEALNNIIKHSGATKSNIFIGKTENFMNINIIDNGKGFVFNTHELNNTGIGLPGISERVKILDGNFKIDSLPGIGTILKIKVPVTKRGNTLLKDERK